LDSIIISTPLCAAASGYLAAWDRWLPGVGVAAALGGTVDYIERRPFRDGRLPLWFYAAEVVELWAGLLAGGFFARAGCVSW
jgi:hypothetical protein